MGITLWCILIATPDETPAMKAIEKYSYCMYSKFEGLTKVVEILTKTNPNIRLGLSELIKIFKTPILGLNLGPGSKFNSK